MCAVVIYSILCGESRYNFSLSYVKIELLKKKKIFSFEYQKISFHFEYQMNYQKYLSILNIK